MIYWVVCLMVILGGLRELQPQTAARVERIIHGPVMDLERPFRSCAAAHAAGFHDIPMRSPAYTERQDGDGDGLACEPYR